MKRTRLCWLALVFALTGLVAMPAMARFKITRICTERYGTDGYLCERHCDFFDNNGNYTGSIDEDYGC